MSRYIFVRHSVRALWPHRFYHKIDARISSLKPKDDDMSWYMISILINIISHCLAFLSLLLLPKIDRFSDDSALLPFPLMKTSFLFNSKPKLTKNYRLYPPTFRCSVTPIIEIGFSWDPISKTHFLVLGKILGFPASRMYSFDVIIRINSIPFPQ